MYDLAIIGAGPAGLSAAITARARNKSVVVISNKPEKSPLAKAGHVDNYPGLPQVSGLELLTRMTDHAESLGAEFLYARVITVLPYEDTGNSATTHRTDETPASAHAKTATVFSVTTSEDYLEARSVIIAIGANTGGSPLTGETEYLGRGVSYCATCDGMLYRNATVCVLDYSTEALKEALFLAEIGATVRFITTATSEEITSLSSKGIEVHHGKAVAIEGDMLGVTGVRTAGELISCQGVFVLRPSVAPHTLLSTLELDKPSLRVDERMCTNIPGVFAAGDCTGKPLQVAKAVGEGQMACLSAVEYLDGHQ